MLNKKQNMLLFCICIFFCFQHGLKSHVTSSLNGFSKELKRDLSTSKEISIECVLYVLQQGHDICSLLEKFDSETESHLGVKCSGCNDKILYCAELAGYLCAAGAQTQLDNLKKLLAEADLKKINQFTVNIANEERIECIFCKKFVSWVKLEETH